MLRPDFSKWKQSEEDVRRLGIEAEHPRSRERFQALYMIGSRRSNATRWAETIKRNAHTVMEWIHLYNREGPEGVVYRHSGGRSPLFCPEESESLVETVKEEEPSNHELPGHGWTLKKLRLWVERKLGRSVSRSTLRRLLKAAGMSWKKCKKLLARANPERRAAYVQEFQGWFEQMVQGEVTLVYVDEVHIHQDMDLGYTWGTVGETLWRKSTSPGLDHRLNWYGAYDFTQGRCLLWENGYCKGDNTIEFLRLLVDSFSMPDQQLVVIWDGASHHRSQIVKAEAERLGILLLPLPGYSPDLNPIEGLWKWMREDVTQHFCHPTLQVLRQACLDFIQRINLHPLQLISRLWPKFDLDPDYEKLLVSN